MQTRFDRNTRFFGDEGQARLRTTHVTVVGIGGLGTHVVQQLAFLGVGVMTLIDDEELDETNRNRYIGSRADDPMPGTPKTLIGERLIRSIDPSVGVTRLDASFTT
ncbi:MAG: HesA/MoeB/ThiF family protein, partial [Terriglobia bacterium]